MGRLMTHEVLSRVQKLAPIAGDLGLTMAQLAVAWVLQNDNVAAAIVGATRPEQVAENAKASGVKLSDEVMRRACASETEKYFLTMWKPPKKRWRCSTWQEPKHQPMLQDSAITRRKSKLAPLSAMYGGYNSDTAAIIKAPLFSSNGGQAQKCGFK